MICHVLVGARQRCTVPDPSHRGPHWQHTETVPEDCECEKAGIYCTCGPV